MCVYIGGKENKKLSLLLKQYYLLSYDLALISLVTTDIV